MLLGKRANHHNHLTAFHLGHVFDLAMLFGVFRHPFKQFAAQILVRHFASTEPQGHLHLVTVFQELKNVPHFDVVIMRISVGSEFDLFHLDNFLLFARFRLALLLFVLEFSEIHDLDDRRICIRRDLDKIKPGLFSKLQAAFRRDDADIFTFCADQADFRGANAVVDAGAGVALWRRIVWSAGYGIAPLKQFKSGL